MLYHVIIFSRLGLIDSLEFQLDTGKVSSSSTPTSKNTTETALPFRRTQFSSLKELNADVNASDIFESSVTSGIEATASVAYGGDTMVSPIHMRLGTSTTSTIRTPASTEILKGVSGIQVMT
jgi:hypothetical protein